MEFFEVRRSQGNGLCSDDACPCPEVVIPRGSGYLYIPQECVDFRRDARTIKEAEEKALRRAASDPLAELAKQSGAASFTKIIPRGVINPILVCEQGARLRKLNLNIASEDAKYWWETGKVPLRATPFIGDDITKVERVPSNSSFKDRREQKPSTSAKPGNKKKWWQFWK